MPQVSSSLLSHVSHEDAGLTVTFYNGKTAFHPGVPEEEYQSLLASHSKGFYYSLLKQRYPGG